MGNCYYKTMPGTVIESKINDVAIKIEIPKFTEIIYHKIYKTNVLHAYLWWDFRMLDGWIKVIKIYA